MQTQAQPTAPSPTYAGAELFVARREEIPYAEAEITRHLARVEGSAWDVEDVIQELTEGRALAWGLRRGAEVLGFWITRIENTWTRKYGLVWITAGSGLEEGLRAYRDVIEPWFWSQGCQWIEVNGRRGWKRVMPDYEESAVVLRKYR